MTNQESKRQSFLEAARNYNKKLQQKTRSILQKTPRTKTLR